MFSLLHEYNLSDCDDLDFNHLGYILIFMIP